METLKITQLHRSETNKEGVPYKNKEGRPYTRLGIKTNEYGEVWLSGFSSQWNADWKLGSTIEVEVERVKGKDGKEYLNFSKPDPMEEFSRQLNNAIGRISALEKWKDSYEAPVNPKSNFDVSEFPRKPEVNESDLPF